MEPKHTTPRDKHDWTEDDRTAVRNMRESGKTIDEIGDAFGCTRGAISGLVSRMGLPPKPKRPATATPRPSKPVKARPNIQTINARAARMHAASPPDMPVERFSPRQYVAPEATRKTLLRLSNGDCRFPCDTDPDGATWFCGASQAEGLPYCAGHCRIAYQSADARGRKRDEWRGQ